MLTVGGLESARRLALFGSLCLATCLFIFILPQKAVACSNDPLRTGPSAQLPDCRAYELVTPGAAGQEFQNLEFLQQIDMFPTEVASSLRESLLFATIASSFLNPPGGGADLSSDVWQTQRQPEGWQIARHVTPKPDESIEKVSGGASADHEYVFVYVGPQASKRPPGEFGSLYLEGGADYLGDSSGHFELTGCGSLGCEQYAQGRYISPGGNHVIFSTGKTNEGSNWCKLANSSKILCKVKQLEPDAPPLGTAAVYDRPSTNGPTHVVSLLPGNVTPGAGEDAFYQGASADGTAVAFKINSILYVRVDNEATEEVTSGPSLYAGFSADGRYLFYLSGGNIHRFDTSDESDQALNSSGDAEMMNVSEDGTHVYFISPSQLDGAEGTAGQPNIYAWSGGTPEYVATVAPGDLEGHPALGRWTAAVKPGFEGGGLHGPGTEASQVTPEGEVLIFEASAKLTSYENAGHKEIYRYEAAQPIECVSCNPLAATATSDARLRSLSYAGSQIVLHNLSDDGSRVFFETSEALVQGDVDAMNDSYEWRRAPGIGGDVELGLISSGGSLDYPSITAGVEQNTLVGITRDGRDVFFNSQDALVPGAGVSGTPAIYDARIGGGFAEPEAAPICTEEACRGPAKPAPTLAGAGSSGLQGGGNVVPKRQRRRHRHCRRGGKKHKRCSKKRSGAGANSSASRMPAAPAAPRATQPGAETGAEGTPTGGSASIGVTSVEGGEFEKNYGLESVGAEVSTVAAARHPDFTLAVRMKSPKAFYSAKTKGFVFKLPPGLYGNPNLTPRCSTGNFLVQSCPIDSQVGLVKVRWIEGELELHEGGVDVPLYNLAPSHPDREIARFGLNAFEGLPVFVDVSVRTASDYGVTVTIHAAPSVKPLLSAESIIWGNPADPSHNKVRMTPREAQNCGGTACEAPGGERSPEDLGPIAFMTNPSACGPWSVGFEVNSYQLPGRVFSAEAPVEPGSVGECQDLPFAPSLEARPTTDVAGAPTGLKSSIKLPQGSDPSVPSTATMREARVTLPEGMVINPSAADGLEACSDQQVHFHEEVDAECPDAAKIGSLKVVSPALANPLEGAVYQRSPEPGHLFGLWLVVDQLGLHVKIPGEVKPDPETGQITAVFADLPQVPVGEIDLEVWGGARAPLRNPDTCGTYETTSVLTPWSSDPPATPSDRFRIDRSPSGGCTAGNPDQPGNPADEANLPFAPRYEAGTVSAVAKQFSPLVIRITRQDGEQQIVSQDGHLPPGLIAKLAGTEYCSEAALTAAAAKTGNQELASPSCPASSHIGSAFVGLGAGPSPFFSRGEVYLAPAYKGAPLSLAFITPAVAGPFDLGDVVVRDPLYIDPETVLVHDAAQLPTILEGVPLQIRDIRLAIDRPEFTLTPTNCNPLAFTAEIGGAGARLVDPSDDTSKSVTDPFQVGECARLGFKPKLAIGLTGGTKRGDYPALSATYKARGSDANLGTLTTSLPHSEFLAQEHIVTICTRVQFAAHTCPKGSVYGQVKAWTPLLDKPLEGPVYLRSSSHPLPDLVLDLRGQIEVAAVGRVDSHHGGIRVRFEGIPDAPVSKVVLKMKGGKKGLLTNSTDICRGHHKATVNLQAQNGRRGSLRPELVSRSCGKHHGKAHAHR